MNRQELIYLSQKDGLEAAKLSHVIHKYITAPNETNKFEVMKILTCIISTSTYMIEEINKEEFARQITEHVQAVEKGQ